jgi:hypothetical protein
LCGKSITIRFTAKAAEIVVIGREHVAAIATAEKLIDKVR